MEDALRALRLLVAGKGIESEVFRYAALVPHAGADARQPSSKQVNDDELKMMSDGDDEDGCLDQSEQFRNVGEQLSLAASTSTDFEEVAEIYTWGRATNYQLGFGVLSEMQPLPRSVPITTQMKATQVKMLACGRFHSIAVTTCGSVFSWGVSGKTFRLGIEPPGGGVPPPFVVEPTQLQEFGASKHCAVKAAAGLNHSLVLTAQGKIYAWGSNSHGELGAQGVPTGSEAHARRPSIVKASLKSEEVCDIAAGVEHSLCTVASGNVFAWGSNTCGSLGLGAPPTGPAEVAAPQQLPHMKGAYAVAASHSGRVSIVLAAHGDAMMFGALSPQVLSQTDTRGGPASSEAKAAQGRFFVSSRVRRHERKDSGEGDDWQMQRGCAAAGPRLLSVTLGAEEAFAIDAEGVLWTWPLNGPRPCVAKAASLSGAPLIGSPSAGRRPSGLAAPTVAIPSAWSTVAAAIGCLDTLWAVDRTEAACLWRLKRAADVWHVERYEQLAQLSCVACGPEHQAAVVTYKRPAVQTQQDINTQVVDQESDEEVEAPAQPTRQVLSLQKICEDRLLRSLSPRNLNLVCEVGWEFRRPELLDHAFAFLHANASLMFSRQHLASLSQLPLEVLCAFEMAASGKLLAPSAALDFDPWDFPPEEWRASPDHDGAAPAMSGATESTSKVHAAVSGTVRRRKRGGSGAGPSPKAKAASPASTSLAAAPVLKDASPLLLPSPAIPVSPKTGPTKSPKSMPAAGSVSNMADPQKWVEVQNRRKPNGAVIGSVSGKASPTSAPHTAGPQSPPFSPAWNAAAVSSPTSTFKQATQNVTLGDFVLPKAAVVPRKSSASDAENADETTAEVLPRGWVQSEPAESPVSLKDILAEKPVTSKRRSHAKEEEQTADSTHCSWGYDAMPSQRPKGPSVYEVQQLERSEKSRAEAEAEIREIEAMFAALEIAEQEEEREKLGIAPASVETPTGSSKSKQPSAAAGSKSEQKSSRTGRGRGNAGAAEEKKQFSDAKKKSAKAEDEASKDTGTQRQKGRRRGNWNDSSWSGWHWNSSSWWEADAQSENQGWSAQAAHAGRGSRGGRSNRGKQGYDSEGGQRWYAKEDAQEDQSEEATKQEDVGEDRSDSKHGQGAEKEPTPQSDHI